MRELLEEKIFKTLIISRQSVDFRSTEFEATGVNARMSQADLQAVSLSSYVNPSV